MNRHTPGPLVLREGLGYFGLDNQLAITGAFTMRFDSRQGEFDSQALREFLVGRPVDVYASSAEPVDWGLLGRARCAGLPTAMVLARGDRAPSAPAAGRFSQGIAHLPELSLRIGLHPTGTATATLKSTRLSANEHPLAPVVAVAGVGCSPTRRLLRGAASLALDRNGSAAGAGRGPGVPTPPAQVAVIARDAISPWISDGSSRIGLQSVVGALSGNRNDHHPLDHRPHRYRQCVPANLKAGRAISDERFVFAHRGDTLAESARAAAGLAYPVTSASEGKSSGRTRSSRPVGNARLEAQVTGGSGAAAATHSVEPPVGDRCAPLGKLGAASASDGSIGGDRLGQGQRELRRVLDTQGPAVSPAANADIHHRMRFRADDPRISVAEGEDGHARIRNPDLAARPSAPIAIELPTERVGSEPC